MTKRDLENILNAMGQESVPDNVQVLADQMTKQFTGALITSQPAKKGKRIMKTKILRYAAAAAVLVAAGVIGLSLYNPQPAYSVEQTIDAMRSVTSLHAYTTDWDGSQGEVWVQINPETGDEEYYCVDQENFQIVGTPQATYYYDKDKNLVRIRKKYVLASNIRITHFFEDLILWVQKYNGELCFYPQFENDLNQKVILVHASIPAQENMGEKEFIVRVDPQTKFPINMEAIKCREGEGVKNVDRLEYNMPIPEGIFEFTIPEGAQVVVQEE